MNLSADLDRRPRPPRSCPELPSTGGGPSAPLYRIAREAVADAIKHGRARRIHVRLGIEGGRIALEVPDAGADAAAVGRIGQGVGLEIMRYRAESIGAALDIDPAEPTGTGVACRIGGGS